MKEKKIIVGPEVFFANELRCMVLLFYQLGGQGERMNFSNDACFLYCLCDMIVLENLTGAKAAAVADRSARKVFKKDY